jgi:superfamily II DNA/RNA helicase
LKRTPPFEEVAVNDKQTTVATLKQEYLFMPARVKMTYLVHLVREFADVSAIVFCSKCRCG